MALLSKKEFARKCGMPTNQLSVAINRDKKVMLRPDDLIDDADLSNKLFFDLRKAKGLTEPKGIKPEKVKVEQVPRSETYVELDEPQKRIAPNAELMELDESEQTYKHFLAKKTENESALKEIEIAKKKGDVIPSELIGPLVMLHNQSILNAHKNADEEILTYIGHKYEITVEDKAKARQKMVDARNSAMKNAISATMKGLQNIIVEYSEKRGVGQK